jgi:hypothetical protein
LKDKDKAGRKKTTAFIEPELHQQVKVKIAQTPGASIQKVVTALLTDWVGGKRQVEIQPEPTPGPDRYRADLENLLEVLERGTPEDRSLVRGLINRSAEAVRGRKAAPVNPLPSSRSRRDQHPPRR